MNSFYILAERKIFLVFYSASKSGTQKSPITEGSQKGYPATLSPPKSIVESKRPFVQQPGTVESSSESKNKVSSGSSSSKQKIHLEYVNLPSNAFHEQEDTLDRTKKWVVASTESLNKQGVRFFFILELCKLYFSLESLLESDVTLELYCEHHFLGQTGISIW